MAGKYGCEPFNNGQGIDPAKHHLLIDFVLRQADGTLTPLTPPFGHENLISNPYVLMNDILGCCVISGIYHQIMLCLVAGGVDISAWTEEQWNACVEQMYKEITSWDGVIPPDITDQGTDPDAAYTYWQTIGFILPDGTRHTIDGFMVIDLTNWTDDTPLLIQYAIKYFCGGGYCLSVPQSAVDQFDANPPQPWTVVDPNSPIDGSHYVHQLEQVDADDEDCDTWGKYQRMVMEFVKFYGDIVLVPVDLDALNKQGLTLDGLDTSHLLAIFQSMEQDTPPAPAYTPDITGQIGNPVLQAPDIEAGQVTCCVTPFIYDGGTGGKTVVALDDVAAALGGVTGWPGNKVFTLTLGDNSPAAVKALKQELADTKAALTEEKQAHNGTKVKLQQVLDLIKESQAVSAKLAVFTE